MSSDPLDVAEHQRLRRSFSEAKGPFLFDTRYEYQYLDTSIQIPVSEYLQILVFIKFRPVWQDPDTEQFLNIGGFRNISASLLSFNS
jgi:hypothetical protein